MFSHDVVPEFAASRRSGKQQDVLRWSGMPEAADGGHEVPSSAREAPHVPEPEDQTQKVHGGRAICRRRDGRHQRCDIRPQQSSTRLHLRLLKCFTVYVTPGSTTIEKYDLRTNTWVQVGVMNGRRLQFGVAVIDNKLYVVGGRDGLKTSNMVESYNPVNNVWSTMPPMSTHRHGLGEYLEVYYLYL